VDNQSPKYTSFARSGGLRNEANPCRVKGGDVFQELYDFYEGLFSFITDIVVRFFYLFFVALEMNWPNLALKSYASAETGTDFQLV
jgi:hypothetical protein